MKLCDNCNERPPLFSVRGGPLKIDRFHSLCKRCFRDQTNSVRQKTIRSTMERSINDKQNALDDLINDGEVIFVGKDVPNAEDPTDPTYIAKIYVIDTGAGTEAIYEKGSVGTGIPSICVTSWDKDSLKYLKHWLFKVLDDQKIYRANKIHIEASGFWRFNFTK
jgi:hypothetical protein